MSCLDEPVVWTEFFSVAADKKLEHHSTFREIAARIRQTKRREKKALPWIKLACFGDVRSIHNSLKTNINVIEITGIEADYDGGTMSASHAADLMAQNGVGGMVYTTPSSTDTEPRWRVLCPSSRPYPPQERARFLARLNGLLGGVLDPASFNVSLSYYYGNIADRPAVAVKLVEGGYIDLADELDAGAIGRHRGNDDLLGPPRASSIEPAELVEGDAERLVMAIPNDEDFEGRDEWRNFIAAIHHQFNGDERGLNLALRWSAGWHDDDPSYTEATYQSFTGGGSRPKTFRWIIQRAVANGVTPRQRQVDPTTAFENEGPEQKAAVADDLAEKGRLALEKQLETEDPTRFNREHAIVVAGGKLRILYENGEDVEFWDEHAFKGYYKDATIPIQTITNKIVMAPAADAWLGSSEARKYKGIAFDPSGHVAKDKLNLWRGFGVPPSTSGSCDGFLEHLFENTCKGVKDYYDYLIRWFAHIVQRPTDKPGVAVVLRGAKGVGKDVIADRMSVLFGAHYTKIDSMDHLIGRFNSHLGKALFVHCEEAFWAGSKPGEGKIQTIITSPVLNIEYKGLDVQRMRSYCRLFLTSNHEWVVPASHDERRYFVLDVGEEHLRDIPYFLAMKKQLEAGGYGKLMQHLTTMKLNGFEVRDQPSTSGLVNQKIASLKGVRAYWHTVLENGELPRENAFNNSVLWRAMVSVDALYHHYVEWWKENKGFQHGDLLSKAKFGRELGKLCPSRHKGVHRVGSDVYTVHKLPPLTQAREEFATYLNSVMVWE